MSDLTQEQARAIINQIKIRNGGADEEIRKRTDKDVVTLLATLSSVHRQLATVTSALAAQLYSTDSRFIYELIQNAEDNFYEEARKTEQRPFVSFALHSDRIVMDCNEDGFSEDNVRAICDVGKSTKTTTAGYIGEKGIGFKSVFKVARKVNIQSEPFAFSFDHGDDQNGLGMVTPFNAQVEAMPSDVGTRMTLWLKDSADYKDRLSDFQQMPDNLLLFLSTLKVLYISLHDESSVSTSTFAIEDISCRHLSRRKLTKHTTSKSKTTRTTRYFALYSKKVQNLPRHDHRQHVHETEIVLAFPLKASDEPIIEKQYVFAYLPMRNVGFNFLIQSDFITQGNREDVIRVAWNEALLDGVAETFRDGVVAFSSQPNLVYSWMLYLPSDAIVDPFWAQLGPKIFALLAAEPILKTRDGDLLRTIRQARVVPSVFLDERDEPLLPDLPEAMYLSEKYDSSAKRELSRLGLRSMHAKDYINRIKSDLGSEKSRIKSSQSDNVWQSRFARLCSQILDKDETPSTELRALPLLHLDDGSWVSIQAGQVFWPSDNHAVIPRDLGLRLLLLEKTADEKRTQFYSELGVKSCKPKAVLKLIKGRYNQPIRLTIRGCVRHLQYLYAHPALDISELECSIPNFDRDHRPIYRNRVAHGLKDMIVDDIYFESDAEYSMSKLYTEAIDDSGEAILPHKPYFLHPEYLMLPPTSTDENWISWLEETMQVRQFPQLLSRPGKFSYVFRNIMTHLPEKLVGLLKAHWGAYEDQIRANEEPVTESILEEIRETEVMTISGTLHPLDCTYIATPQLKAVCETLDIEESFQFVKLDMTLGSDVSRDWKFLLEHFGVGDTTNLAFYLDALDHFSDNAEDPTSFWIPLIQVYEKIQERVTSADHETIRQRFEEGLILDESIDTLQWQWVRPGNCVWASPVALEESHILSEDYLYAQSEKVKSLFTLILGIHDAGWTHFVCQLERMLGYEIQIANVAELYKCIRDDIAECDIESLRAEFARLPLIYVPDHERWCFIRECLWTSKTYNTDVFAIRDSYSGLEDFFIGVLNIQKPDLTTYIKELISVANGEEGEIERAKVLIFEINSRRPKREDLERLKLAKCIPIKHPDGEIVLSNPKSIYAIVDRVEYAAMFYDKIATLDFDMRDVHTLQPFIKAIGIRKRLTSRSVVELTGAQKATFSARLTVDYRQRASALSRCAAHYTSVSNASSANHLTQQCILQTRIYLSKEISKVVCLIIDKEPIALHETKGTFHVEQEDNEAKIFMSTNSTDRYISYCEDLPAYLASTWGISKSKSVHLIGNVLQAPLDALEGLLDRCGVLPARGEVSKPDIATNSIAAVELADDIDYPSATPATPANLGRQSGSRPRTPDLATKFRANTPLISSPGQDPVVIAELPDNSDDLAATTEEPRSRSVRCLFTPNPSTWFGESIGLFTPNTGLSSATPSVLREDYQNQFQQLLDNVIRAAIRCDPQSHERNVWHVSESEVIFGSETQPDSIFESRSENQIAHDKKIGAAGELFAFEWLSKMKSSIARSDWRSSIRHEACIHQRYEDIKSWKGPETADIVYIDQFDPSGDDFWFHKLLPESSRRVHRPITYYFEVKTTTLSCDTRFTMSKAQVKRMESMIIDPKNEAPTQIYVILRVFKLGQKGMGVKVIVDPETKRRNGELNFEAESHTVSQNPQTEDVSGSGLFGTPLGPARRILTPVSRNRSPANASRSPGR